jgi:queuosine precursor transporter
MSNELLLIILALIDILFVFIVARTAQGWLMGTIVANLVMGSIFGAKLIMAFGLTANVGNIFYACVFLATYFILEKQGRSAGMKTVWFGIVWLLVFTVLTQIAALLAGSTLNGSVNTAITTLFSSSLRITIASITAYAFAQSINIHIYEWIKAKTKGKVLWLQSMGATILSQLVDSMLFFSIAFFSASGFVLLDAIISGWAVKALVVVLAIPFLYLDRYFNQKKS